MTAEKPHLRWDRRFACPAVFQQALAAIVFVICASSCLAQRYELGGAIGYGVYRNGSIYAPDGKAQAGIRNRFAAGAVFSEDLYDHLSGEVRYLFHDGHPFLSSGGVKTAVVAMERDVIKRT